MRTVLTNILEAPDLDFSQLNERFDVYQIALKLSGEAYVEKKKSVTVGAKSSEGFLATADWPKEKLSFFLFKTGSDIAGSGDGLEKIILEQVPRFLIEPLLSRAVPALLPEMVLHQRRGMVNEDRYYRVVGAEVKPSKLNRAKEGDETPETVLSTVNVEPAGDWSLSSGPAPAMTVLSAKTVGFTSTEFITSLRASRDALSMLKRERFEFSNSGFMVSPMRGTSVKARTSMANAYVRGTIGKKKTRVGAYHVDHSGETVDPAATRAGVLDRFLKDVEAVYGSAYGLNLKQVTFETVHRGRNLPKRVSSEYNAAFASLYDHPILIINRSNRPLPNTFVLSSREVSKFSIGKGKAKEIRTLTFLQEGDPVPEGMKDPLPLLIMETGEPSSAQEDPYREFKTRYPRVATQACTYDTVFVGKDNKLDKNAFPFLLMQLAHKLAIEEGTFLEPLCCPPAGSQVIVPVRNSEAFGYNYDGSAEQENKSSQDTFSYYKMEIGEGYSYQISRLSESDKEALRDIMGADAFTVFGRLKKNGQRVMKRAPVLIFPKEGQYIAFVETDASVLPDNEALEKQRLRLVEGRKELLDRSCLEDIIASGDVDQKVIDIILNLLRTQPVSKKFAFQTIDEALKLKDEKSAARGLPKGSPERDEALSSIKTREPTTNAKGYFKKLLDEQGGLAWRDGIKRTGNDEALSFQDGLNFALKEGYYYVGASQAANYGELSTLSRLYKLVHNAPGALPEGLDKLFMSFSVRHKQTTVYPLACKLVREFAKNDMQQAVLSNDPPYRPKAGAKDRCKSKPAEAVVEGDNKELEYDSFFE